MTHLNNTRVVTLHFPLQKISEPVVTRLVTEFDLSPNLLRADVDAATGGWLTVGLSGDEARIGRALDWLRNQGLTISEAAA